MPDKSEEIMEFSLEPIVVQVKVGGRPYELREATETVARKYRNKMFKSARVTDGKFSQVEGIADLQAYLVSMCMVEIIDGKDFVVNEGLICTWPSRVVKALFDKVNEISDLLEKDDSKAKKSLPSTEQNSD